MFGGTISSLQRYAPIRERRAYMHDRAAVSWQHMLESCQRAIYISQVRNLGDSLEVLWSHLFDGGKNRRHSVVYPDVNGAQSLLYIIRRSFNRIGIGDVNRKDQRSASLCLHFQASCRQSVLSPGN